MKKKMSVAAIVLIAMVSAVFLRSVDIDGGSIVRIEKEYEDRDVVVNSLALNQTSTTSVSVSTSSCNLFLGEWIYDDVSRPLYEEGRCSFQQKEFDVFACEKHGRKDLEYQKWRWQPRDCNLPRFNGAVFMEKIRGKRVVFVGDSLNRNQWTSLLCLIESSLDETSDKSIIRNDNTFVFKTTEYNATIEFYWSPFLVESNCDDPDSRTTRGRRTVRISSIEKHAMHWTDADLLVFDTFIWWLHPNMTLLWGSCGSSNGVYKKVEMKLRRFEMALTTWSDWLEVNINRTKTNLFFMSLSPYHDSQGNCYNETQPISKEGYRGINATDRDMMHVAESTLEKLRTRGLNITYLNVTHLSDYRKDAHLSIYRKLYRPLNKARRSDPISYSDCIHWCLPGVPDVWNEILYSYIIDS